MRFFHTGDIHLDTPFSVLPYNTANERRKEILATFIEMMNYAIDNSCDVIFISGDLFDTGFVSKTTLNVIRETFERIKCPVIICPGNHDYYSNNGIYATYTFPDNVHIFKEPVCTRFDFDNLNLSVYGYAFISNELKVNPILEKDVALDSSRINVLCAHTELDNPSSGYAPISSADIADIGFNYAALGHVHKYTGAVRKGNTTLCYCGIPTGRAFDELDFGGAIIGEINRKDVSCKHINFAKSRFMIENLTVDETYTETKIISLINDVIDNKKYGAETSLRVVLNGVVNEDFNPVIEKIQQIITGVSFLQIVNQTMPIFNLEKLKDDSTIRGEFYRIMLPMLSEGSIEQRKLAADALRLGLSAIERNITL